MLLSPPGEVAAVLLIALVLDWLFGDPGWLWRRLPHPVVVVGRIVERLERRWNDPAVPDGRRFDRGRWMVMIVVTGAVLVGSVVQVLLLGLPGGALLLAALMSSLLAFRGLVQHVDAVAAGLEESLDAGRRAVAHVVGRDPEHLDEPAVARAAIESAAENFSDGVAAPLFWGLLLGLPGMLACKAINTMDSMVGHRSPRYLQFGQAAARLDDLVNLPASRIAAALLVLAGLLQRGADPAGAVRAIRSDARSHRSPNAGWPEAAMAGALGLRLAGPRRYGGEQVDDAWMGDGRTNATAADVRRATALLERTLPVPVLFLLILIVI